MSKRLKIILGVCVGVVLLLFIAMKVLRTQTKKASPEQTATFSENGQSLSVFYCRPSKRNRDIFGKLVPFGQVWRTGANEATTFTTGKDILVGGKALPAGTYTLWTIPNKDHWTIIFNSQMHGWGVSLDSKASRDSEFDVLKLDVPVQALEETIEQFTIAFNRSGQLTLDISWDRTKIAAPIS